MLRKMNMKQMVLKKIAMSILVLLGLCVLLLINGCAAKASRMVPTDFEVVNQHLSTVTLSDSVGGKETNPLWTSQISNTAFTEALSNSLVKSGLFQGVIKQGIINSSKADYILDVTILKYNQPWVGINFDISINTKWELTDTETLVPVWSETFESTYKAKLSEALIAAQRLQRGNEGAVRKNIREGIRRLSLLKL